MACPDCAAHKAGWDRAAAQLIEATQRGDLNRKLAMEEQVGRLAAVALNTPLVQERDALRLALRRMVELVDHAESKVPHSPWCNGVHEGSSCEGDYLSARLIEECRALASPESQPAPPSAVTGTTSDSAPVSRQPTGEEDCACHRPGCKGWWLECYRLGYEREKNSAVVERGLRLLAEATCRRQRELDK